MTSVSGGLLPAAPTRLGRMRSAGNRVRSAGPFSVVSVVLGLLVAGTIAAVMARLGLMAWERFGIGVFAFYWDQVLANPPIRQVVINTVVVVALACTLATFVAAILAWLSERTDAGIGATGRFLPLIPFLMPGLAFPLGWLFLTAPNVGALNVLIRGLLERVGVNLETGPIDLFTWPALVFLYTVPLIAYAYLVISSAMRNLDPGLEEAAKMAGANPPRILLRIVLPALRPAMISAFLISMIPALAMLSIPLVVGYGADITVVSVYILRRITDSFPVGYAEAFLVGLLLVVPIMVVWWIQRRSAATGRLAVIGGRASAASRLRLGRRWRLVGRAVFVTYGLFGVGLPLFGLIYVAGSPRWTATWPQSWDPIAVALNTLNEPRILGAFWNSLTLGIISASVLIVIAQLLTFSQQGHPRLGRFVDALAKSPAAIANILLAIGVLLTLGGPPFRFSPGVLLVIAYIICYIPYASVVTTAAQQQVGKELIEAAKLSGASDFRMLGRIVTPLTRNALLAGLILVFVLISGDINVALILASGPSPVIGSAMWEIFEFGGFVSVANFALVVTLVSTTAILTMALLASRSGLPRR